MNYVEWLRVRNCLRVTAIVLGIIVVLGLLLRVAFDPYHSYDAWISKIEHEPGTNVSQTVLPDGSHRTTVDNAAKHEHIVIDDRGDGHKYVEVTEPSKRGENDTEHANVGGFAVDTHTTKLGTQTSFSTNSSADVETYAGFACIVALIIATVLGAPFARENDGHLEIAFTKPVDRVRFALGKISADLVGIAAAMLMADVALFIIALAFGFGHLAVDKQDFWPMVLALVSGFAWYAILNAATASLQRGYGAILGFAWPVALLVLALSQIPQGYSAVQNVLHGIFSGLAFIDPLTYSIVQIGSRHSGELQSTLSLRIGMQLLLFVVYSFAAVLQWRRVEA